MLAILIWLIGMFIFFFILYNVIQHALNTSDAARDLAEIKQLLRERAAGRSNAPAPPAPGAVPASSPPAPGDIPELRDVYVRCPACGHAVQSQAAVCPDCGLSLK